MTTEKKKEEKTWQEQLNDTVNRINNREKFEYDLNGDALWNQYKDQYTRQGALAMEDTMGKAQAMTGGYANSYAQQVGQQTYNAYMQDLNGMIPELYNMALSRYQTEGDDLYNKASFAASMAEQERGTQADNYEKITALIAIGYNPTDEELAGAGMSREQANAIAAAYGMGDDSSSDSYTPGSYDANPSLTEEEIRSIQEQAGITVDGIWGPNTAAAYKRGIRPKSTEIPVTSDTDNTKLFRKSIMTSTEFAKHGNRATVNGKVYTKYREYVEACLANWTDNGVPQGGSTLTDGEVEYLINYYNLRG